MVCDAVTVFGNTEQLYTRLRKERDKKYRHDKDQKRRNKQAVKIPESSHKQQTDLPDSFSFSHSETPSPVSDYPLSKSKARMQMIMEDRQNLVNSNDISSFLERNGSSTNACNFWSLSSLLFFYADKIWRWNTPYCFDSACSTNDRHFDVHPQLMTPEDNLLSLKLLMTCLWVMMIFLTLHQCMTTPDKTLDKLHSKIILQLQLHPSSKLLRLMISLYTNREIECLKFMSGYKQFLLNLQSVSTESFRIGDTILKNIDN